MFDSLQYPLNIYLDNKKISDSYRYRYVDPIKAEGSMYSLASHAPPRKRSESIGIGLRCS